MSQGVTRRCNGLLAIFGVAALFAVSQQAGAAGFAVKEQSVTYLGNAFSGTASSSLDASTNWYNPAGLTELKYDQILGSLIYLKANIKLENATATNEGFAVTGANNPTRPISRTWIPGLHMAYILNKCVTFGFSVTAPFGLSTEYGANDIARFIATESRVTTIDFTPSIAYKINKEFSVGIGFDAVRTIATLNADTNFGAAGYLNNKATGWGYGAHAGVLYKPSACTKMGLAYFSRITPHLAGGVSSINLPVALRSTVTGKLNFPDRLVYSITQKFNESWTAMADVEWTHWSVFKYVELDYNTGASVIQNYYYKNAFRLALGTDYKYSQCLTFKGGLSFEQTPVTTALRSPSLPDSNRYWIAVGLSYAFNRNLALDAAYAHVFFNNAASVLSTTFGRTLFGNYRTSANLVGLQLKWNFV